MALIKTFASTDPGAPVLSGTAGALATLLKTCLVDGRGAGGVQSLTVASGIATATYASGHPFAVGSVGLFAGATPAALNGEQRILTVAANSVTFAAPGVPDGAATGAITSKLAAAGWQQLFSGSSPANVLCLKPAVVEATGCVLRVDDTGTTNARVVGYEAMTDASTGSARFPTDAQMVGGLYWGKSDAANATSRAWRMWADERLALIWISPYSVFQTHGTLYAFGDIASDRSGDAYACVISGALTSSSPTESGTLPGCLGVASANGAAAAVFLARSYTGIGGAVAARKNTSYNTASAHSGMAAYSNLGLSYPNPADNSLRLSRLEITVPGAGFRGAIPGVFHTPQTVGEAFQTGDRIDGTGEYAGRTLMAVRTGPPGIDRSTAGCVFVDVNGPWSR